MTKDVVDTSGALLHVHLKRAFNLVHLRRCGCVPAGGGDEDAELYAVVEVGPLSVRTAHHTAATAAATGTAAAPATRAADAAASAAPVPAVATTATTGGSSGPRSLAPQFEATSEAQPLPEWAPPVHLDVTALGEAEPLVVRVFSPRKKRACIGGDALLGVGTLPLTGLLLAPTSPSSPSLSTPTSSPPPLPSSAGPQHHARGAAAAAPQLIRVREGGGGGGNAVGAGARPEEGSGGMGAAAAIPAGEGGGGGITGEGAVGMEEELLRGRRRQDAVVQLWRGRRLQRRAGYVEVALEFEPFDASSSAE